MVEELGEILLGALGGFGAGYMIRDIMGRRKLDPDVMRGAQAYVEEIRQAYRENLRAETDRHERREAALVQLASRPEPVHVPRVLPGVPREEVEEEPSIPEQTDLESAIALATQGPDERQQVLDALVSERGLTVPEANAILDGNFEDLPEGERLDLFIAESMKDQTGLS